MRQAREQLLLCWQTSRSKHDKDRSHGSTPDIFEAWEREREEKQPQGIIQPSRRGCSKFLRSASKLVYSKPTCKIIIILYSYVI